MTDLRNNSSFKEYINSWNKAILRDVASTEIYMTISILFS